MGLFRRRRKITRPARRWVPTLPAAPPPPYVLKPVRLDTNGRKLTLGNGALLKL